MGEEEEDEEEKEDEEGKKERHQKGKNATDCGVNDDALMVAQRKEKLLGQGGEAPECGTTSADVEDRKVAGLEEVTPHEASATTVEEGPNMDEENTTKDQSE